MSAAHTGAVLGFLDLLGIIAALAQHLVAYVYLAYLLVVGVQAFRARNQPQPPEPRFGYPLFALPQGDDEPHGATP
jgi:threonine/homoserine/homoserine lactone efflux protein